MIVSVVNLRAVSMKTNEQKGDYTLGKTNSKDVFSHSKARRLQYSSDINEQKESKEETVTNEDKLSSLHRHVPVAKEPFDIKETFDEQVHQIRTASPLEPMRHALASLSSDTIKNTESLQNKHVRDIPAVESPHAETLLKEPSFIAPSNSPPIQSLPTTPLLTNTTEDKLSESSHQALVESRLHAAVEQPVATTSAVSEESSEHTDSFAVAKTSSLQFPRSQSTADDRFLKDEEQGVLSSMNNHQDLGETLRPISQDRTVGDVDSQGESNQVEQQMSDVADINDEQPVGTARKRAVKSKMCKVM